MLYAITKGWLYREVRTPDISVLMATHDRPLLLGLAIGHFLRQRDVRAELIVVDDSEAPRDIPEDPRIRLLRVERGTPLGAKLNVAAERAEGYLLAKWDDDDYYGPGYLAKMTAFLRCSQAEVVFAQPFLFYDLIANILRVSDKQRCSGATLTMSRLTWASTRFRSVREAVDATFLLDIVAAAGPEACAGLNLGGEFIQVRHDGHLWQHMPDGKPVSDYLAECAVSDLRLGRVVDRRTLRGWAGHREQLMAGGTM